MLESPASAHIASDVADRSEDEDPTQPSRRRRGTARRTGTRIRTSHACDRCRNLRTKCSGGEPCSACMRDSVACIYSDRKRERDKKIVENDGRVQKQLRERLMLIAALREVCQSPGFLVNRHPDVMTLLQRVSQSPQENSPATDQRSGFPTTPFEVAGSHPLNEAFTNPGEKSALSTVGSPSRRGELSGIAHLYQGFGLSGYIGKLSEVAWIKRVNDHLISPPLAPPTEISWDLLDDISEADAALCFFTDEENLLAVDEDFVEPLELPHINTAVLLSEAFFHSLHGCFYFLEREQFLKEMMTIYRSGQTPSWPQRPFLGICNMIWAIGTRWLQMTGLVERIDAQSHILYYARARALGLDHRIQFDHPDVRTVQGMGLTTFYLLINNSIQRAWNFLGQTIRHAVALGVHLRTSVNIPASEQETRMKIWSSLYRLETLLSSITGRPQCVQSTDMAMPDPISQQDFYQREPQFSSFGVLPPWNDIRTAWLDFLGADKTLATSFSGGTVPWPSFTGIGLEPSQRHFSAVLELCHLSADVGARLFMLVPEHTWFDVQTAIRQLALRLHTWQAQLPNELRVDHPGPNNFDPRARLDLAMYYYSVKMMLYRPCLCEIQIDHESNESQQFNQACARYCVEAAVQMIGLLPERQSGQQVLQVLPWWSLLHYLGQAAAVLLLELCLRMQHVPQATDVVVAAMRKALGYLSEFSSMSTSAMKAWSILNPLFEKAMQRMNNPSTA